MKPLGGTRSKLKYKSAPAESNQKPPAGVRRELAGGYGWPRAGRRRASRNGTFPRQVGYVFPTGGPFKDGDEAASPLQGRILRWTGRGVRFCFLFDLPFQACRHSSLKGLNNNGLQLVVRNPSATNQLGDTIRPGGTNR
jgi:hypothetical protein